MAKNNRKQAKSQTGGDLKVPLVDLSEKVQMLKNTGVKRTTFTLSEEAIAALDWCAERYDISQREVLDFIGRTVDDWSAKEEVVVYVKEMEERAKKREKGEKSRKTLAFSIDAMKKLVKAANTYGVSRDTMLEAGILLFRTFLQNQVETRMPLERIAEEAISKAVSILDEAREKLAQLLDSEDPLCVALGTAAAGCEVAWHDHVGTGASIETLVTLESIFE